MSVGGSAAVPSRAMNQRLVCNVQAARRGEDYVLYSTSGPVPLSVYQRLKKLEDRILELEGLSPEYFQSAVTISTLKCWGGKKKKRD